MYHLCNSSSFCQDLERSFFIERWIIVFQGACLEIRGARIFKLRNCGKWSEIWVVIFPHINCASSTFVNILSTIVEEKSQILVG